jgi:glycosyltransferase involved in cell wall biosynthesis
MRIWLINVGEEIPADPGTPRLLRAGILADQLAKRGHEVTWWNSSVNHQRKVQRCEQSKVVETEEGYRLVLLYGRLYQRNISAGRIFSQLENAREFRRISATLQAPDVILCGYPTIELAEEVVRYAKVRRIPVATDFRDLWPDIIEDHAGAIVRIVASPLFSKWRRSLKFIVDNSTAIVGITDSFVDWALAKGNRRRSELDRTFHLAINPTIPDAEQLRAAEAYWDKVGVLNGSASDGHAPLIGGFAGTFSTRLDIKTIVEGALKYTRQGGALKLVLCGEGPERQALQNLARGNSDIIFAGWRNAAEIRVLLQRSNFGMLPYPSTPDFVRNYPNKVGEYLSAGLPIMTGLKGIVRELLDSRGIGFFFEEANSESAADCFGRIIAGRGQLEAMKPSTLSAYHSMFDGEQIYPAFCDYLEFLGEVGRVVDEVRGL